MLSTLLLLIVTPTRVRTAAPIPRRMAVARTGLAGAAVALGPSRPPLAHAAGDAPLLAAVLEVQRALKAASTAANAGDLVACRRALASLPASEQAFKAVFDASAEKTSYKTKFKDQNAFLVYYTQGFDGPGRARLGTREDVDPQLERQSEQLGRRNEAWSAADDARATLDYLVGQPDRGADDAEANADLRRSLASASAAVQGFLDTMPGDVLSEATGA